MVNTAAVRIPVYAWPKALAHLAEVREQIRALASVSAWGAENCIVIDMRPLEHRYAAGERSAALYEAMMGLTWREGA